MRIDDIAGCRALQFIDGLSDRMVDGGVEAPGEGLVDQQIPSFEVLQAYQRWVVVDDGAEARFGRPQLRLGIQLGCRLVAISVDRVQVRTVWSRFSITQQGLNTGFARRERPLGRVSFPFQIEAVEAPVERSVQPVWIDRFGEDVEGPGAQSLNGESVIRPCAQHDAEDLRTDFAQRGDQFGTVPVSVPRTEQSDVGGRRSKLGARFLRGGAHPQVIAKPVQCRRQRIRGKPIVVDDQNFFSVRRVGSLRLVPGQQQYAAPAVILRPPDRRRSWLMFR